MHIIEPLKQFMTITAPFENEKRTEMFYLTFYLWLYGIRHMVKDHSDSERGNPLLPHWQLFPISSKGSFICTITQALYHGLCYTSHGALAGTRNSSMGSP